jgi:cob(I)alamin adenosyltransferase
MEIINTIKDRLQEKKIKHIESQIEKLENEYKNVQDRINTCIEIASKNVDIIQVKVDESKKLLNRGLLLEKENLKDSNEYKNILKIVDEKLNEINALQTETDKLTFQADEGKALLTKIQNEIKSLKETLKQFGIDYDSSKKTTEEFGE